MRGFATDVGSKADIGGPPLTQLQFMSTRPRSATARAGAAQGARRARVASGSMGGEIGLYGVVSGSDPSLDRRNGAGRASPSPDTLPNSDATRH